MTQALPLLLNYGRTRMAGGQREGEHWGNRRMWEGTLTLEGLGSPRREVVPKVLREGSRTPGRDLEEEGGSPGDKGSGAQIGDRKEYLGAGVCRNGGVLHWR